MPTTDIFQFDSPDLVNLQKLYKRAPKQVTRAAVNVMNTLAKGTRIEAIANIKAKTITRSPKFVDRSIWVTKAKHGQPLGSVESSAGSVDLSKKGRSSGFEEIETGQVGEKRRLPTLSARDDQEKKTVIRGIRMDRWKTFWKPRQFSGPHARTKGQKTMAMIQAIRKKKIAKRGFIIPIGQPGELSIMKPGIWRMNNAGLLKRAQAFSARRRGVKKVGWMEKAVKDVASVSNIRKEWRKETAIILKAWR